MNFSKDKKCYVAVFSIEKYSESSSTAEQSSFPTALAKIFHQWNVSFFGPFRSTLSHRRIRFANTIMSISNNSPNSRAQFPGLLLLVHAAAAQEREDTSFVTPTHPTKSIDGAEDHPPKRPKPLRYPSYSLPPKKRVNFRKCSPGKVSSSSVPSPVARASPRKLRRVTVSRGCQKPRDHLIWEDINACRQAANAPSSFLLRPRKSNAARAAQSQKKKTSTEAINQAVPRTIYLKTLDGLKRRMKF